MKFFVILTLLSLSIVEGASFWGSIQGIFGFGDNFEDPVQAVEDISQECVHYATSGSCEFYECLERRFPCGEYGYALRFGKHFCNKIATNIRFFTPAGQRYTNATGVCLTSQYSRLYQESNVTCQSIKEVGVNSIVKCHNTQTADYPSYCQFVAENTNAYWKIFDVTDMSKILSLNEPRVWRSLIEQSFECGTAHLQRGVKGVIQRLKNIWDNIFG